MQPGNMNATEPAPSGAGESDEKALLTEIAANIKEILVALKGAGEVVKEGQAGAGLENEDKKAKPVESKTAGVPQTDIKSKVEVDKIVNKDIAELRKEIAELRKSKDVDAKAVDAVRAPADPAMDALGNDSLELRKSALHDVITGKDKRSVMVIAREIVAKEKGTVN